MFSRGHTVEFPSIRHRLSIDDRGQDLIEYAVIATFISLLAVIAATALNGAIGSLYNSTSHSMNRGANFSTQNSAGGTPADCQKDKTQSPSCK
jgi:Flp pilus assembly pilin Flp